MAKRALPRSRGKLKSALRNTIDAFASRNSDRNGYWLLGQLYPHLTGLSINLLQSGGEPHPVDVIAFAETRARTLFVRQLAFSSWPSDELAHASLRVVSTGPLRPRLPDLDELPPDHPFRRSGRLFTFRSAAGRAGEPGIEVRRDVFVAPQKTWLESRRHEDDWG